MPYNYPVLLPLIDDLVKIHRMKPTKEWKNNFDNYLRNMPPYYITVSNKQICVFQFVTTVLLWNSVLDNVTDGVVKIVF